ncbi:thrombospondin type 3 repeat-containing protein [Polyangium mundeleinium]|uniref:Thrombospondin type 3 repeat-containing protein n=1 Tax=Polyangium mundeleinium TaxID=2995306 RepID=A0ABT5EIE8_9BACT|nr:thrombospondin type 3 repeat-containing protein [Polyangium mundeleinium]MDC0741586.1 thrombospondin type 3 repeat-containing protein [Polyangium mundeleinium]
MSSRVLGAAALGLSLLAPRPSHAQTSGGIALNQLDPAPAGDTFFSVPSPQTNGHLVPRGLVLFDYAHNPLVAALADGGTETSQRAIVGAQAFLHIGASLALWNRLLVSASFPLAVLQQGESPILGNTVFPSPTGVQAGDLRLGARIRLFGETEDAFQMAAGATLHAPTGPAGAFVGDNGVRLSPELLLGGRFWHVAWSAAVRPVFRTSDNPSTLSYGAGIAFLLLDDHLRIGPELSASTPLQEGLVRLGENRTIPRSLATNAELLLGIRGNAIGGLWVGAAVGPGLSEAIGTPTFRALGLVAWSPETPKPKSVAPKVTDTDGDGLIDTADACPHAFGEKSDVPGRNGCPKVDRDEDGVVDLDDVCPEEPGAASGDPKRFGCPPDRDGDNVPDAIDVCPDTKGEAEKNGCPTTPQGG